MTTTYYVVPAGRAFDTAGWAGFPSLARAEQFRDDLCGDSLHQDDFGIFELRLVAGSAKLPFARTMHIRGDRRIITGKHYLGGYSAHDDGLGEDASPYGYGKTPEEAIAELLEALDPAEQNREAA